MKTLNILDDESLSGVVGGSYGFIGPALSDFVSNGGNPTEVHDSDDVYKNFGQFLKNFIYEP